MSYTGKLYNYNKSAMLYRQQLQPHDFLVQPTPSTGKLITILYHDIIPQLGGASNVSSFTSTGRQPSTFETSADVLRLIGLLEITDLDGARDFLINRRLSGLPLTAINLNLLAPAARHMGELWNRDEWDFNAVTLGVANIQKLMRELAKLASDEVEQLGHHHRALLAPVEGENHTFGLSMLGDFFGRDGWDVWGGPGTKQDKLLSLAGSQFFDIVGLSIADERWLENARSTIAGIRRVSKNPNVKIMMGGPLVNKEPTLAAQLGADATGVNGAEALRTALTVIAPDSTAVRVE